MGEYQLCGLHSRCMGMGVKNPVYGSPAWLKVRAFVLRRDGHWCQIRLPGCRGEANSVDHVVELEDGGAPYDAGNLQAACRPCNSAKGNYRRQARGRGMRQW